MAMQSGLLGVPTVNWLLEFEDAQLEHQYQAFVAAAYHPQADAPFVALCNLLAACTVLRVCAGLLPPSALVRAGLQLVLGQVVLARLAQSAAGTKAVCWRTILVVLMRLLVLGDVLTGTLWPSAAGGPWSGVVSSSSSSSGVQLNSSSSSRAFRSAQRPWQPPQLQAPALDPSSNTSSSSSSMCPWAAQRWSDCTLEPLATLPSPLHVLAAAITPNLSIPVLQAAAASPFSSSTLLALLLPLRLRQHLLLQLPLVAAIAARPFGWCSASPHSHTGLGAPDAAPQLLSRSQAGSSSLDMPQPTTSCGCLQDAVQIVAWMLVLELCMLCWTECSRRVAFVASTAARIPEPAASWSSRKAQPPAAVQAEHPQQLGQQVTSGPAQPQHQVDSSTRSSASTSKGTLAPPTMGASVATRDPSHPEQLGQGPGQTPAMIDPADLGCPVAAANSGLIAVDGPHGKQLALLLLPLRCAAAGWGATCLCLLPLLLQCCCWWCQLQGERPPVLSAVALLRAGCAGGVQLLLAFGIGSAVSLLTRAALLLLLTNQQPRQAAAAVRRRGL